MKMDIKEQAAHAVRRLKAVLEESAERRLIAADLANCTTEELINRLLEMEAELHELRRKIRKAGPRVTVEKAARLILEDPATPNLNASMIAEIIKTVFKRYGQTCETTEGSIRWYITKKTQEWNIIPRRPAYDAIKPTDTTNPGLETDKKVDPESPA